jgi:hypothetical protein
VRVPGEVIGCGTAKVSLEKIASVDMHDAIIVAVMCEEFFGESEECEIRNTIVFENDSPFDMLEKPGDGGWRGGSTAKSTAEVLLMEQSVNFAIPIDMTQDCITRFLAFLNVARSVWTGSVGRHVKRSRLYGRNLLHHLSSAVGSVEDD